jgi:hypothetical protein
LISANVFSRQTAVWHSVAPTLDQVVRWANREKIPFGDRVRSTSDPSRNFLISETAFLLAGDRIRRVEREGTEIEQQARSLLRHLPRSEAVESALADDEWLEANSLCDVLLSYVYWLDDPIFQPVVPGCGVVDECVADIVTQSELVEVKAVARPFRSTDFRQVLTYLAMYYSKGVVFDVVTLVNPRTGHRFSIAVKTLCGGVSGHAMVEVLQDIIGWMTGLQVSG